MPRVLILGGTAEARLLAERLAGRPDLDRHAFARRPHGFAGAAAGAGARRRLRRQRGTCALSGRRRIDALIDATHPYAASSRRTPSRPRAGLAWRSLALRRPAWSAIAGDRWTEVERCARGGARRSGSRHAVSSSRSAATSSSLSCDAPQHHYLIRSVDPVDPPLPLPHAAYVTGRGPFSEADDRALMLRARHRNPHRQEQRRHGELRQDRRGAHARHRRDPAAPAGPRRRRPPWRRSRMQSPGSIMRSPRRPRAACRPADCGRGGRSRASRASRR